MITVQARMFTQVLKNKRAISLYEGDIVDLDLENGDTYAPITCQVISEISVVNIEDAKKDLEVDSEVKDFDIQTAKREELFAYVKEHGIELPSELMKKNVSADKLRAGILDYMQG